MARRRKGKPIHGWLVLDKPEGVSSNAALVKTRHLFNAQKAGHAGTLDPLATGVLPIAFGEATKTIPYIMAAEKAYTFSIRWGKTTDTLDGEGQVTDSSDLRPDPEDIEAALKDFIGEQDQTPPVYSAIKLAGERACDRVRRGEKVSALSARRVCLFEARRLEADSTLDESCFQIRCGKGYYVRALARDLAQRLGVCGHVGALRRLSVGPFLQKAAKQLDMLATNCHKEDSQMYLLPVIYGLAGIPTCMVSRPEADRLRKGQDIALTPERLGGELSPDQEADPCVVLEGDTLVALARPVWQGLRPVRVFNF